VNQPKTCGGRLLVESANGRTAYRTVRGQRLYRVRCETCGATDDVTDPRAACRATAGEAYGLGYMQGRGAA